MQPQGSTPRGPHLEAHGIVNPHTIWWNLPTPALYEQALQRREGLLGHLGPLVVRTGHHTGRSSKDRFLVREPSSQDKIWWGKINQPIEPERYDALHARLMAYLQGRDLFVQDCYAGADPDYRMPIRIITETAWHSLFARNIFRQELDTSVLVQHKPEFTVIDACGFNAVPETDGIPSESFVIMHFGRKEAIIGGTAHASEIKKAVFTVMNYLLPQQGVLSMQCSANYGNNENDAALFFGLSGTGKTTLCANPERTLIGDDEHGWSDRGVFNLEGGCYAKVMHLSPEGEPEIYQATRRFGTLLENVAIHPHTRRLNLNNEIYTENTRASFPVSHLPKATRTGLGGHPKTIVMLTADALGVLPPVARLNTSQAMYYFLSGYTAKIPIGIERSSGPRVTFSACFGSPFMTLNPAVYAGLLGEKITRHKARVWLINTGWSGGPYGTGERIALAHTRAMVSAVLDGTLEQVPSTQDPVFGLQIPQSCPNVPTEILHPRATWKNPDAYDEKGRELVSMFAENFKQFAADAPAEVLAAGPHPA